MSKKYVLADEYKSLSTKELIKTSKDLMIKNVSKECLDQGYKIDMAKEDIFNAWYGGILLGLSHTTIIKKLIKQYGEKVK